MKILDYPAPHYSWELYRGWSLLESWCLADEAELQMTSRIADCRDILSPRRRKQRKWWRNLVENSRDFSWTKFEQFRGVQECRIRYRWNQESVRRCPNVLRRLRVDQGVWTNDGQELLQWCLFPNTFLGPPGKY